MRVYIRRLRDWALRKLGRTPFWEQEPEEPDFDEAQEWEDFDPSSTMEAMYGGDDDY